MRFQHSGFLYKSTSPEDLNPNHLSLNLIWIKSQVAFGSGVHGLVTIPTPGRTASPSALYLPVLKGESGRWILQTMSI